MAIQVRFWGARGGIAVPGPDTLKYGGNTSCIEVICGPHRVILDAGTGLRLLGQHLAAEAEPLSLDLLLSHVHLDHIIGLGFFAPLYRPGTSLRVRGGMPPDALQTALAACLSPPLMPNLQAVSRANLTFDGFLPGATLTLHPGLTVATAPLLHSGGSTGYRIEWEGASVAYITDTEHTPGAPDPAVAALAAGADVLIYDASYTDAELPAHTGWGHSTWQEALRIAGRGGVGRVVLFHHNAARTDSALDAIVDAANALRPGTLAAAEGMELRV